MYEITESSYRLHLVGRNTLGDDIYIRHGILRKHQYAEDKYIKVSRGRIENGKLVLTKEVININNKFKVKYRV